MTTPPFPAEKPDIAAESMEAHGDDTPDARRLPKTLKEAIIRATQHLHSCNVPSPRLDAEILIAHVLGYRRLDLYLNHDRPLTGKEYKTIVTPILRRGSGVPAAYITGIKEFHSLNFIVNESVLIPRPETEFLVSESLMDIRMKNLTEPSILEIGTGSGAVAVTLASSLDAGDIIATDVSEDALKVTRKNCELHDVFRRVTLRRGDLYEPVAGHTFDLIVSNPPYLTDTEMELLPPEVKNEPRVALAGGPDGLGVIAPLVAGAPEHLRENGCLIIEIGAAQKEAVIRLCDEVEHMEVSHVTQDYAGHPRVVVARRV
ncbi:MAG: peptide chain release factor N(5)-glutamine methyltransferase [Deltaproteobacteria bacterium]|nr:peptide chain release factor N(5)-glutamine methyltransferase [Candidatus Zymogenaceae bacterium]